MKLKWNTGWIAMFALLTLLFTERDQPRRV